MRIVKTSVATGGKATGYSLWLSARDTDNWRRKPGAAWPGSTLAGHRVFVGVDSNGLHEITLDGHMFNANSHELEAMITDVLPAEYRHLWPVWA